MWGWGPEALELNISNHSVGHSRVQVECHGGATSVVGRERFLGGTSSDCCHSFSLTQHYTQLNSSSWGTSNCQLLFTGDCKWWALRRPPVVYISVTRTGSLTCLYYEHESNLKSVVGVYWFLSKSSKMNKARTKQDHKNYCSFVCSVLSPFVFTLIPSIPTSTSRIVLWLTGWHRAWNIAGVKYPAMLTSSDYENTVATKEYHYDS